VDDEAQAAIILKQLRAAAMKQPVFGLSDAGAQRSWQKQAQPLRLQRYFPYGSNRQTPLAQLQPRFEDRFHEKPEQFASLAYDAMNALLDSICKAGLNRARIHDALADIDNTTA